MTKNKKVEEDTYVRFIKMYIKLYGKGFKPIAKFFYWMNRIVFSCDIPCTVIIGKRLHLPHFGLGVVLHPCTLIGDDVTIYQQVTIGARGRNWNVEIGNNVLLGAGCKILGTLKIGNDCKIGANCVVLESIPAGKTVVGVPAHFV